MKLKAMNINSCKVFIVMIVATIVLIAGAVLMSTNQCFAKTVYSDDNVTATVNDDGISGTLEIKDSSSYLTENLSTTVREHCNKLESVNGTALKDIIKFNNNGYVEKFYIDTGYQMWHFSRLWVSASGPKGFFNGSGHLRFYDSKGDYYDLSIWLHDLMWHEVHVFDGPVKINKIEWWS